MTGGSYSGAASDSPGKRWTHPCSTSGIAATRTAASDSGSARSATGATAIAAKTVGCGPARPVIAKPTGATRTVPAAAAGTVCGRASTATGNGSKKE